MDVSAVPSRRAWAWFACWALVGACWGVTILGALTIGPFILPLSVGGTIFLLTRKSARIAAAGAVAGAGIPLLYVASLNRSGPGPVCTGTRSSGSCAEQYSPWLFLIPGLLFVLAGFVVFVLVRRAVQDRPTLVS
jgi:hypothetical protein